MDEISQFTKTSNPCEIARVVVNKNYQSKKIGEFMIKEIIKELKNKSFDSIRLAVEINHIPAIKLYEKCGFNRIGEHFMYEHHYYLYELLF
jgi:ribosomal protein S18 acetylase RimI-like enzyme